MKPFLTIAAVFAVFLLGYLARMADAASPNPDPSNFILAVSLGIGAALLICSGIAVGRSQDAHDRKQSPVAARPEDKQ